MDTMTSTATKAVTNTKLAIATLAMLAAGGAAFLVAPPIDYSGAVDPDAKSTFDTNQLFVKATTKYNGGSKTDYCYTFANTGKTYLMEGIAYNGRFQTWQKNCAELNFGKTTNNYQCVNGACVNMVAADLMPFGYSELGQGITGKVAGNYIVNNVVIVTPSSTFTKSNLGPMVSMPFEFRIKNAGLTDANNFTVEVYYSNFDSKPFQVQSNLSVGANKTLTVSGVLTDIPYSKDGRFTIKIDSANTVNESNENNNTLWFDVKFVGMNCVDSDGGQNLEVKGRTTGFSASGMYLDQTDFCRTEASMVGEINEFVCTDNQVFATGIKCPNGCKDGACVTATSTQSAKLTLSSKNLDSTRLVNGTMTVGRFNLVASTAEDIKVNKVIFNFRATSPNASSTMQTNNWKLYSYPEGILLGSAEATGSQIIFDNLNTVIQKGVYFVLDLSAFVTGITAEPGYTFQSGILNVEAVGYDSAQYAQIVGAPLWGSVLSSY